ncbi:MAG TPA: SRPBCC domain-containing protein [Puia sp.]|nr:SRPBCC domain-containing protein [Puia sp.]
MKSQDYHCSFTADVSAEEAFDAINDVKAWWATCFEGHARAVHDKFSMPFGKTWVDFEVVELVPGKRVVWLVTDCNIEFVRDKKEWKDTRVVFEINPAGRGVEVSLTHVGLVPQIECYEDCEQGWNHHFGKSLLKLLTEKVGLPA